MMCASAKPVEPPPVELFHRIDSPPGAVLPMICHCWNGEAFQRTIPPNRLSARFSLASVTVLDGVGCVDAATKGTTVLVVAEMFGNMPASECGAAIAVGVVSS